MATTATRILRTYNHCLNESQRVLDKLGFRVHQGNANVQHKDAQTVGIVLNQALHFEGWPFKSQTNRYIDIVADVKETVRLNDERCTKSSVVVNYFLIEDDVRTACDAVRYDYDETVQQQHPVCHAQNANSILDDLPETFPNNVEDDALSKRHQAVRIPTAFINLAGLIEKITADHLPSDSYEEFWSLCDPFVSAIPCHSRDGMIKSISESASVRSRFWYPR